MLITTKRRLEKEKKNSYEFDFENGSFGKGSESESKSEEKKSYEEVDLLGLYEDDHKSESEKAKPLENTSKVQENDILDLLDFEYHSPEKNNDGYDRLFSSPSNSEDEKSN